VESARLILEARVLVRQLARLCHNNAGGVVYEKKLIIYRKEKRYEKRKKAKIESRGKNYKNSNYDSLNKTYLTGNLAPCSGHHEGR